MTHIVEISAEHGISHPDPGSGEFRKSNDFLLPCTALRPFV
jgi:hypothetical protein